MVLSGAGTPESENTALGDNRMSNVANAGTSGEAGHNFGNVQKVIIDVRAHR